jgi:hypothetical protein
MKYLQRFKVTGTGHFPIDMLRYDSCFPANPHDVPEIADCGERRTVELKRWVYGKDVLPTAARWASFSWTVEPNSVVTVKP